MWKVDRYVVRAIHFEDRWHEDPKWTEEELRELTRDPDAKPQELATGPREKESPSELMQKHLAWRQARAPLWTEEELARQVEEAIEMIVDYQVLKAPRAVREERRGVMREIVESARR